MVNVYIQVDGTKIINANSGAYIIESDGWHLVYSGDDVPELFPKGIMTDLGGFNYAYIDGEIVERSADDIAADEAAANPAQETHEERIAQLEEALELILSGVTE